MLFQKHQNIHIWSKRLCFPLVLFFLNKWIQISSFGPKSALLINKALLGWKEKGESYSALTSPYIKCWKLFFLLLLWIWLIDMYFRLGYSPLIEQYRKTLLNILEYHGDCLAFVGWYCHSFNAQFLWMPLHRYFVGP